MGKAHSVTSNHYAQLGIDLRNHLPMLLLSSPVLAMERSHHGTHREKNRPEYASWKEAIISITNSKGANKISHGRRAGTRR